MLAVDIQGLRIVYSRKSSQEKVAVQNLDLSVREGEFFGLLGPNGAGKTSVVSSLTGLLDIEQGDVRIFGLPAGSLEAKRKVGVVPQELVQHGFFTVREILHFFAGYYGKKVSRQEVNDLLDRLELGDQAHKRVSQLSGGMKRRLLIAKALIHKPPLLLLDEPSAGVDIELRARLWDLMKELNRSGRTVILTTHYLEEAQRLCERVAIMNHGRLISLDRTENLMKDMFERRIQLKLSPRATIPPRFFDQVDSEIYQLSWNDPFVQFSTSSEMSLSEALRRLKLSWEHIEDVQTEQGALEEAFLRILGQDRKKNA